MRLIQRVRQDAGYKVGDLVYLRLQVSPELATIVEGNLEQLKKTVKAKKVELVGQGAAPSTKLDAEFNTKLDETPISIGVKKV